MSLRSKLAIAAITIAFIGCSLSEPEPNFPGLSNRGLVPLSSANAYVGSNLFLASEMEKSPALLHFIQSRGGPQALRVIERKMRSPELVLYYPREDSMYIAELNASRSAYNWVVRGPIRIPRHEARSLTPENLELTGEPLFVVFNQFVRYDSRPPIGFTRPIAVVKTPTPKLAEKPLPTKPKVKPKAAVVATKPKASTSTSGPTISRAPVEQPTPYKPLNFDQMAILMSKGFAERDKNGDVMHTVKAETETLEAIATWYSADKSKAGEIAAASGLDPAAPLKVGARVRIPLSIVKNGKRMVP